uniref:Uncharacterized protein n=1 Tax=Cacopsylla melanoneura TaxID=428564 RepID=A0A8D9E4Q8_9HEMI
MYYYFLNLHVIIYWICFTRYYLLDLFYYSIFLLIKLFYYMFNSIMEALVNTFVTISTRNNLSKKERVHNNNQSHNNQSHNNSYKIHNYKSHSYKMPWSQLQDALPATPATPTTGDKQTTSARGRVPNITRMETTPHRPDTPATQRMSGEIQKWESPPPKKYHKVPVPVNASTPGSDTGRTRAIIHRESSPVRPHRGNTGDSSGIRLLGYRQIPNP